MVTSSGDDYTALAETLGVAGGQKANDEARQCKETHNVFGQHGHQHGLQCGKTEAHRKNMEDHVVHGWIMYAPTQEDDGQGYFIHKKKRRRAGWRPYDEEARSDFKKAAMDQEGDVQNEDLKTSQRGIEEGLGRSLTLRNQTNKRNEENIGKSFCEQKVQRRGVPDQSRERCS